MLYSLMARHLPRKLPLILLVCLAAFSSCGKPDAEKNTPNLSEPEQFQRGAPAKPQAEVSASSGPVQLTFRLLSTKIKSEDSLWFSLELKNVGDKPIPVTDLLFRNPSHSIWGPPALLYIEAVGPDGKRPPVHPVVRMHDGDLAPDGPWTPEAEPREVSSTGRGPVLQPLWLEPGKSTSTVMWARPLFEKPARLIPGYTHLWEYHFYHPGKYKLRAAYDHQHMTYADVIVETPWVEVEVTK